MNNVYDALEICLQELEQGADIDTILFRYPDFAEDLRPILEAAVRAKHAAAADPSVEVVRRNRAKVLQQAAQIREANARSSRRMWSVPLRRALVSLAVILVLFVSGTGLVRAASTTLPGDDLYPVKRTWEDVLVLLTFNLQSRQALEIEHETKRLEELYELFAEGRSAEVDFAGTVTRQNGDLWLVSKVPVVISPQTDLRDGPILLGSAVRVRGITQGDGSVLAERIDLLSKDQPLPVVDDDDDESEVEQEDDENENEENDDNSGKGSGDDAPDLEETEEPEDDSNSGSGSRDDSDNDSNEDDDSSGSGTEDNGDEDNSGRNDNNGGDDDRDNSSDDSGDDD